MNTVYFPFSPLSFIDEECQILIYPHPISPGQIAHHKSHKSKL